MGEKEDSSKLHWSLREEASWEGPGQESSRLPGKGQPTQEEDGSVKGRRAEARALEAQQMKSSLDWQDILAQK